MQVMHVVFVAVCTVAAWVVFGHVESSTPIWAGPVQVSGQAAGATTAEASSSKPAGEGQYVCFIPDIMPMLDRMGCSAVQCHG